MAYGTHRLPVVAALPVRDLAVPLLAALLAVGAVLACGIGAVPIPAARVLQLLAQPEATTQDPDAAVLWLIRLPRVVLAIAVGAALGAAGAAIQGLFRNP